MKWIEYQFTEDMNWINKTTYWQFDHVIPTSSFDLTNEIELKKCFSLVNLRPLSITNNAKKGSKINYYLLVMQELKFKFFQNLVGFSIVERPYEIYLFD